MTIRTAVRATVALLLLLAALVLLPAEQQATNNASIERPREPETTQRIYAPLPKGGWVDAALVLNNNSPDDITVRPTFFAAGIGAAGAPVTLRPAEVRWLALSQSSAQTGRDLPVYEGVELEYVGQKLELAGQITLVRGAKAGAIDVPFSGRGDYQSAVQEAVWPTSRGARTVIAIGNASEVSVALTLTDGTRAAERLELGAHETRTIVRAGAGATSGADSMRIESIGPIGSVRATGYVEVGGRFVANVRFYDPGVARQPNVFATNLRVAGMQPTMILKNTSDGPITATPRFLPFDNLNALPVELPSIVLGPRAHAIVDLSTLLLAASERLDLAQVSVEVVNTGIPGSLIGSLTASSRDGVQSFDVPLREPGPVNQSTGSYPWRIDGDFNTVITVTNVAATPAIFVVKIAYPGGTYQPAPQRLGVGQTARFDMRQLRDSGVAAGFSSTVTSGQFRWSIIQSRGETKLNGRAEIVSVAEGRTSSYSCPECCPWSHFGAILNPSGLNVPVDTTGDTGVLERFRDCYFNDMGYYAAWAGSWNVVAPSVTSMSTVDWGLGRANGLAGGLTDVEGTWDSEWWDGTSAWRFAYMSILPQTRQDRFRSAFPRHWVLRTTSTSFLPHRANFTTGSDTTKSAIRTARPCRSLEWA